MVKRLRGCANGNSYTGGHGGGAAAQRHAISRSNNDSHLFATPGDSDAAAHSAANTLAHAYAAAHEYCHADPDGFEYV
jgi:hypothetical protein